MPEGGTARREFAECRAGADPGGGGRPRRLRAAYRSRDAPEGRRPAPDFELTDTEGQTVRLSDFRGKKNVVLAFYVLAFTGG